jgi:hypothetical protein
MEMDDWIHGMFMLKLGCLYEDKHGYFTSILSFGYVDMELIAFK